MFKCFPTQKSKNSPGEENEVPLVYLAFHAEGKNAKVTLNVDLLIIEHGWIGVDEFNDLPDIGKILAILICPVQI